MTSLIIAIILSALIICGTYIYIQIMLKKAMSGSTDEINSEINIIDKKLALMPKYVKSYGAKKQLEEIVASKDKEVQNLEKSKKELEEFEGKLNKAQIDIEQKENDQQDLKLNKDGDEDKLQELIANFSNLSSKSEDLESRLAQSMDNIDSMSAELELSEEQEELMNKLSSALTSAGGLMRDLIGEQQAMQDRLSMLDGQHEDLEEEYTRLVEQQLGE